MGKPVVHLEVVGKLDDPQAYLDKAMRLPEGHLIRLVKG